MKLSTIIKSSICILGFVGAGNLFAAPANADQASARAATSITNPSSFTQSVSGEALLPGGLFFGGAAAVAAIAGTPGSPGIPASGIPMTPGYYAGEAPTLEIPATPATPAGTLAVRPSITLGASGSSAKINSQSLNGGTATAVSTVAGAGKLSDVVAAILKGTNTNAVGAGANTAVKAASVDDAAAIIKAAAGVNGLD